MDAIQFIVLLSALTFGALAKLIFINGGGLKINYNGFNLDLSTDGLFKKYDEYMDRKVDRELRMSIKNSLDSLDIKTPEDYTKAVIELYKTQNANRNTY